MEPKKPCLAWVKAIGKKGKKIMGEIIKWLLLFLNPLLNERGMAGEDDDEEDRNTQDDSTDEGDDDDSDKTEDDTESDDDLEDDDRQENYVPQSRVDKIVATERTAKEEAERKFDEFRRLGPEAYYKLYPDEKPDDFESEEEEEEEETGISGGDIEAGSLIVRGGKYDGMTLREVSKEDSFEANILYQNYLDSEREQRHQAAQQAARVREDSENEISNFKEARAKEAFNKPIAELSADEKKQIDAFVNEVLDFMENSGRGGGIMEDAFFLMKKDDLLKDVKSQSAKAVIAQLADSNFPTSISSSDTGSKVPGYGEYINMSREKLAEKLTNMDAEEEEKFLKKAPPEFRKKFPDLPYPT